MAKYKAKKGYEDLDQNLASEGAWQKHCKCLKGIAVTIDSLPDGWDKYLDPVNTSKKSNKKEEDKE